MASDTMISGDSLSRTNAIPGRLKIIALSPNLTIAYAGHADPALHVIRRIFREYLTRPKDDIFEILRAFTASADHDVEFLVASHDPQADLRRIWDGILSNPLPRAFIGTNDIEAQVERALNREGEPGPRQFRDAFIRCFTNKEIHLGTGVGGFPILLSAGTDGHRYKGHYVGENWKPIEFVPGAVVYEDAADLETGEWSFHHHIVTIRDMGLPIVASQVPQARVGFVYSPLTDDEAVRVDLAPKERQMWVDDQDSMHTRLRLALDAKVKELAELYQAR